MPSVRLPLALVLVLVVAAFAASAGDGGAERPAHEVVDEELTREAPSHEELARQGEPGPAADELMRRMERAVDREAWERTGVVEWTTETLDGETRRHLWDRERGFVRVEWGNVRVLLDLERRTGLVFRDGEEVRGEEAYQLAETAHSYWTEDSFWLNPVVKGFDDGTERYLVAQPDGTESVLVVYARGGLTPGDAYLWTPGPNGLPHAWRMYTRALPAGTEATWDEWQRLGTGAWVSTSHTVTQPTTDPPDAVPQRIDLSHVRGEISLAQLHPGEDPFDALSTRLSN